VIDYHTNHRLLSRPIKVHWAGWESDTFRLQQAGWKLSVEELVHYQQMRMVIKHDQIGMIGQTNDLRFEHYRAANSFDYINNLPIWQMAHMGRSIMMHNHGPVDWNFRPVDATPQLQSREIKSLEDMVHFASAPLVRTQALVLPEATVDDLLKEILERQQDAKMDYFEDLVRKEGQIQPAHKFHAQIISIPERIAA
jgi:hypothetical protein